MSYSNTPSPKQQRHWRRLKPSEMTVVVFVTVLGIVMLMVWHYRNHLSTSQRPTQRLGTEQFAEHGRGGTHFSLRSLIVLLGSASFGLGVYWYTPLAGVLLVLLGALAFLWSVKCPPGKVKFVLGSSMGAIAMIAGLVLAAFLGTTVLRHEGYTFSPISHVFAVAMVFAVVVGLRCLYKLSLSQLFLSLILVIIAGTAIALREEGPFGNSTTWILVTTSGLLVSYVVIPFVAAVAVSVLAESYVELP